VLTRPDTPRTGLVARTEAATPAGRDRAIDGLRALAILGVVVGHFMVMALTVRGDGALHVTSPLIHLPGLAPVSWVLQMLGLFFLVGGYATARSWDRAQERGVPYRTWVGTRLARLGRPVVASTAILGAALPLLYVAGVPAGTLRTTAVLVVQPLWFIGVYLVITALTPVVVAMDRRLGLWAAAPSLVIVAAVDLLRYGPWHDAVPGWVAMINILPGWAFAYILGVSWAHGRIGRRAAAVLAGGGLALALLLVLRMGYPVSMVGVPGAGRVNSHPPSLLVLALAAAQSGVAILARDRLDAWLRRRPAVWTGVAMVNLSAMSIFCWHQIALMLLSGVTLAIAPYGLPGLHDVPADLAWVGWRLGWLAVHAVVLGGLVVLARRFDAPWTWMPRPGKALALALATGFGVYCVLAIW
jgi:peptidoglycan/LPS O-acetylase OafA/YrhL